MNKSRGGGLSFFTGQPPNYFQENAPWERARERVMDMEK